MHEFFIEIIFLFFIFLFIANIILAFITIHFCITSFIYAILLFLQFYRNFCILLPTYICRIIGLTIVPCSLGLYHCHHVSCCIRQKYAALELLEQGLSLRKVLAQLFINSTMVGYICKRHTLSYFITKASQLQIYLALENINSYVISQQA